MANGNDSKRTAAASWIWAGDVATVTWADGTQEQFTIGEFSPTVLAAAVKNGLEQTLRDSYALPTRDGEPLDASRPNGPKRKVFPTMAEKRAAFGERLDTLKSGQWSAPRGEGEPRSYVFQALVRLYPEKKLTRERFDTMVAVESEKQGCKPAQFLDALWKDPAIAGEIDRLKAERGVVAPDVSGVLDGIADL